MTTPYSGSTAAQYVTSLFRHLWKSSVLSGVLAVALGAQVFFAFGLHTSTGGRILLFIIGAASLVLAVLALRHFIFCGAATTATVFGDLPGTPGRGWVRDTVSEALIGR